MMNMISYIIIDAFINDVIRGIALKSVSFVRNKLSKIGKYRNWLHIKRGEQLRNEVYPRETAATALLREWRHYQKGQYH